jgi:hypothetical protein
VKLNFFTFINTSVKMEFSKYWQVDNRLVGLIILVNNYFFVIQMKITARLFCVVIQNSWFLNLILIGVLQKSKNSFVFRLSCTVIYWQIYLNFNTVYNT